jgi:hypothetical protein
MQYFVNDALFRVDDLENYKFSIYRGQGKWEPWKEIGDWLQGLPISEEEAQRYMQDWDNSKR